MSLRYEQRTDLCTNLTAKKLFNLMANKATNLAVAADVTTSDQLIALAKLLGPEICVFKTHIDIIEDFTPDLTAKLRALAEQYQFLLFEDRKFADIGNTARLQYSGGIYHIANWADIINAHTIPGPGIITGLQSVGQPRGRGLVLLAQMSSAGNLATADYINSTVAMAKQHADFVIGFITTQQLTEDPRFINFTPGVNLTATNDQFMQQYLTPDTAIINNHTDVIIVGRGICAATDPLSAAKEYRQAGWEAYQTVCASARLN